MTLLMNVLFTAPSALVMPFIKITHLCFNNAVESSHALVKIYSLFVNINQIVASYLLCIVQDG